MKLTIFDANDNLIGGQGVAGSNPVIPTNLQNTYRSRFQVLGSGFVFWFGSEFEVLRSNRGCPE